MTKMNNSATTFLEELFGPLTLSSALSNTRKPQNVSATSLAQRLGISVSYLYKVERGARNPSLSLVKRWARELGHSEVQFAALLLKK